jgi:hypothetical protein
MSIKKNAFVREAKGSSTRRDYIRSANRHDDMKYFTDLPFRQNQPLKSAD